MKEDSVNIEITFYATGKHHQLKLLAKLFGNSKMAKCEGKGDEFSMLSVIIPLPCTQLQIN